GGVFNLPADALPKLFYRAHTGEINGQHLESGFHQMHVCVIEAGHYEMTLQVNHSRCRPSQLPNIGFRANREDSFPTHGYSQGTFSTAGVEPFLKCVRAATAAA